MKPVIWLFLCVSQIALAGDLVPFATPEGTDRFARAKSKVDAYKLMNHYRTQTDKLSCGPTSGAIVLNALRHGTQLAPLADFRADFLEGMPEMEVEGKKQRFDPRLRTYTPENFLSESAERVKPTAVVLAQINEKGERDPGLTLVQLTRMLSEAHQLEVEKIEVGTQATARNLPESTTELASQRVVAVLAAIKKNLATEGDYVLINYNRPQLGQKGGGHISPVGAYDEQSDSFLILDVNPSGGPWVWVEASDLVNAMNTFDSDAKANRGVLLISGP
jgi:hypothetical protein